MSFELDRLRYDKSKWMIVPESFERYKILIDTIMESKCYDDVTQILDDEHREPDLVIEVQSMLFDFYPDELLRVIRSCDEFSVAIANEEDIVMRFTIRGMYAERGEHKDGLLFLR